MSRRRFSGLAIGVVALLAVVAVAALGRPLGKKGGGGGGLPATFWSYLFTSALVLLVLAAAFAVLALFYLRRERTGDLQFSRPSTARTLAVIIAIAAIVTFIGFHIDITRLLHHHHGGATVAAVTSPGSPAGGGKPGTQHAQLEWPELVIVFGAILALAAVYVTRRRALPGLRRRVATPAELLVALDSSLDDLRGDPDVRRAIIAAYARMEKALAAAGVPRQPHEAPLEYLERTLLSLDTSAGAVRRLTDLFEWARFSHHEPEPQMREEAVEALEAVRDELRAAEPVETW